MPLQVQDVVCLWQSTVQVKSVLRDGPSLIVHRGSYQANQGRAEPPDKLLHKLPAVHARLLDPTLASTRLNFTRSATALPPLTLTHPPTTLDRASLFNHHVADIANISVCPNTTHFAQRTKPRTTRRLPALLATAQPHTHTSRFTSLPHHDHA